VLANDGRIVVDVDRVPVLDREDAQLKAIESGAAALVITGDLLVSERTLAAARTGGVLVISTAHHTFTAVRLINLSISIQEYMNREFDFCHPEDLMSEVQHTLVRRRSLPVVDNEGKLVGYLSRTDLINAHPKRIILVDHNEQSQAVDGIDQVMDAVEVVLGAGGEDQAHVAGFVVGMIGVQQFLKGKGEVRRLRVREDMRRRGQQPRRERPGTLVQAAQGQEHGRGQEGDGP